MNIDLKSKNGISMGKLILGIALIAIAIFVFSNFAGPSTEDIAKEAQRIITDNWKKEGVNVTVVEDMSLVKKSENEYSGIMEIIYEGKTIQLTGTVICDGDTIQWQPDRQNLFYQMLY